MSVMYSSVYYNAQDSGLYTDHDEDGNGGYNLSLRVDGTIMSNGYRGRAGVNGTQTNTFNIQWQNPYAGVWIDETFIGVIATLNSDYRIKRNITPLSNGALDRIKALKPIQYQHKDYVKTNSAGTTIISSEDDEIHEGFVAHEIQEIIPSSVVGEKDDPVQIQSLKLDALAAVIVKALQEVSEQVDSLQSTIENQQNDINTLKQQIIELQNN